MSEPIIQLKNVSKRFSSNSVVAVDNVSLSIQKGEFVVLLGASGSGKTTLLKMINRLYEPTSGEIYLNGENVMGADPAEYRRKIGYVIQQSGLFPHMTVRKNIGIVPEIVKWPKEQIDARVRELMAMIDLDYDTYKDRFPRELSGGEQQRVGLARGLAVDPDVVLMDEPFGAVDAITRKMLQDKVLELQKAMHKTIVFVTHDIQEAFKLGDRIIVMNRGQIQQYDTVFNVLFHPANDYVRSLMAGENFLDKLQAVTVRELMKPVDAAASAGISIRLDQGDSLKDAYQSFILNDTKSILITDGGTPAGYIAKSDMDSLVKSILAEETVA